MKKVLIGGVLLVVVGIVGFYALNAYIYNEKQTTRAADHKNAEYVIEGERVQLDDGVAETESAPSASSKTTTRYFGNDLVVDLDDDGRDDVVFLLTQESGGSGTFYYVVAALNTEDGYVGSEALFLGDRIAPQTIERGSGNIIVVNYADRAPNEDFSVAPSVGESIWLLLDTDSMQFGEVAQNFEGEADPSRMTLDMKTWVWESALYNDGREVRPEQADAFTLTFNEGGTFSASTDCNGVGGEYTASNGTITFSNTVSTLMYCEGSQEGIYTQLLSEVSGYHFTSRGQLIFDLKFDSGTMMFR